MVDSAIPHLSGTDRSQLLLLPEAVDDFEPQAAISNVIPLPYSGVKPLGQNRGPSFQLIASIEIGK
ncbi:hypothetical protein AGR7A_pAt10071 [Agrobacterium deltaense NCPPB 1641]|uniref:Uncharacterized protein n=1 Tax=Agrobacterium deltaense NCPPB 1641 TaxID=1183425 RepID=A0A1S7U7D3_9HYPH|nr:hypothetical protein AGR7A_pAt10071 [Agrobacterium deltaense NCPPB 1641]